MSPHDHTTARGYRPEIDGLRTFAVMLVVAFHAQVSGMAGGFIGVDMFFVLSGFLITGLLVREAETGRVGMRRFYARRSRRLLPASLVVIVAIAAVWLLTASFVARGPLIGDGRAASLYVANWHFAAQATDYFAIGNQPSPYLHFWSLAVEEQFYLVWPAVLAGCFLVSRRLRTTSGVTLVRVVGVTAAVLSAASVVFTVRAGNDSLAYFGTHNRIYQLLGGAVLGTIAIKQRSTRMVGAVQIGAVAVLCAFATSALHESPTTRGFATAIATLVLLWSITASPQAMMGRVFGWRPLVWLGTLSYAIYLWHWPIVLLTQRFATTNGTQVFLVAVFASVVLAMASKLVVENPIRSSLALSRHHLSVVVAGLCVSALVGIAVAPRLLASTRQPVFTPDDTTAQIDHTGVPPASTVTPAPPETLPSAAAIASVVRDGPQLPCLERRGPACLVNRGHGFTMLVIGDSHLHAIINSLADISSRRDINLWVYLQHLCPWENGLIEAGPLKGSCRATKAQLYDSVLPALHPDVVFAVNRGYDDRGMTTKFLGEGGNLVDPADALRDGLPSAVETVLRYAERLIVLEPWPTMSFTQRDCLATAKVVSACAGTADWPLGSTTVLQQIAAGNTRLSIFTLNDLICPRLPTCDAVVDGYIVRVDRNHLNFNFGRSLAPQLEERLAAAGAFGAAP